MSFQNKEVQAEFFTELNGRHKSGRFKKRFFPFEGISAVSVTLDNLIVIGIIILMVNLLCFVCGIERGKQMVLADGTPVFPSANRAQISLPQPAATAVPTALTGAGSAESSAGTEPQPREKPAVPHREGYAIQLVTYTNNTTAQRELEHLKAQGHESFALKKGNYYVIYSGVYPSKSQAKKELDNFKKRYLDCFVKAL